MTDAASGHVHIAVTAPAVKPSPPPPPCALVIFGATGDLARRKLVPALYTLAAGGALPDRLAVVGVGRRPWSADELRAQLRTGVEKFARRPIEEARWSRFAAAIEYVRGDAADAATYARLREALAAVDCAAGLEGNYLFYLAVPPAEYAPILRGLAGAELIRRPTGPAWSRVVIEKPFGEDLASARTLNQLVAAVLDESQTFRIDHYLGKETVQNILVLRFANSIFEPVWNRKYVSHVQITAAEAEGVGTRGQFYEETGVLRDVVQNHMLEMLTLAAMEPPTTNRPDDVRDEKLKVLRALREPGPEGVRADVVLGQYRGYREEPGVASDSVTPTYAALRVFVDNWRWRGVPFYLRAGKRLARRTTEISIHMQQIPLCLFGRTDVCERIEPNVLVLRVQPNEGIALAFASKVPGNDFGVGTVEMDMRYTDVFDGDPPEAYERLLLDVMRGDQTLFARSDAVETSWAWLAPILEHSGRTPVRDFPNYEPGSAGPAAAEKPIARDGFAWRPI